MKPNDTAHISPFAAVRPLPHGSVEIRDAFWTAQRTLMRQTALLRQWDQLERTGCVDNFRMAAGEKNHAYRGWGFADSDLFKWVEAAALVLGKHPDDQPLAAHADEAIRLIIKAQMDDGYINTYYQLAAPHRRFSNLLMKHELYCMGHLIEAGCTHRTATGRTDLFDAAVKCGRHIADTFGPAKNKGVPGHEEVELALLHLYRATGDSSFLDTARFFLDQRGQPGVFRSMVAHALRDLWQSSPLVKPPRAPFMPRKPQAAESSVERKDKDPALIARGLSRMPTREYFQMHAPLREHTVAEGHSVRAMYLYAAAADLLLETGDTDLRAALERVWDNTINKRTYITGGMGSFPFCEGFGEDYELPNRSYTETCAGIGSFLFSWRMLQAGGAPRFAAQMERTLYNTILGCMSRDGERYFYSNPLVSHGHTERRDWYDVPCCPPNLARTFWSLEQFIYGQSKNALWVHQYIGGSARACLGGADARITMRSDLPFSGDVHLKIQMDQPARFALKLRIPEWSGRTHIVVNKTDKWLGIHAGSYATLDREWKPGDEVAITFAMEPAATVDAPQVKTNRGRIAVTRGPLVYCVQGADNPGLDVHSMAVDTAAPMNVIKNDGKASITGSTTAGQSFTAIPYYDWGNSGPGHMAVWLRAQ
jgi:hypothetical protein